MALSVGLSLLIEVLVWSVLPRASKLLQACLLSASAARVPLRSFSAYSTINAPRPHERQQEYGCYERVYPRVIIRFFFSKRKMLACIVMSSRSSGNAPSLTSCARGVLTWRNGFR